MNKLVIPSILTATVLVASIFALMPIDKASTVHTTIIASTTRSISWTVEAAPGTVVLLAAPGAGKAFAGSAVVSNIGGAGTCQLQDTAAVNEGGAIAGGASTAAPAALTATANAGQQVLIAGATTTCTITLYLTSVT